MAGKLSELSDKAEEHAENERWERYRNVRYETAEHVRELGNWERAGYLYIEIMLFDLQGVTSSFGDSAAFNRAFSSPTPAVARELARFCLRRDMGEEELKAIYNHVVDQFWVDDFPQSKPKVWKKIRDVVSEYTTLIRLEEKVEELGPDELLSEEDAQTFIELKDDYELLQRVGALLEDHSPEDISWQRRKRAHAYLSAVDIGRLGNRWRSKAFGWAGQVVLSNQEKESALKYFEKSLEVADRDDQAALKRMTRELRQELGKTNA